jgi:hypothetical protein
MSNKAEEQKIILAHLSIPSRIRDAIPLLTLDYGIHYSLYPFVTLGEVKSSIEQYHPHIIMLENLEISALQWENREIGETVKPALEPEWPVTDELYPLSCSNGIELVRFATERKIPSLVYSDNSARVLGVAEKFGARIVPVTCDPKELIKVVAEILTGKK